MTFFPTAILRHRHIQTVLAGNGPRRWLVDFKGRNLQRDNIEIINTRQNIKICCRVQINDPKRLAFLIHGWEGSSESTYIKGMCLALTQQNYSVIRINLRDHGDSHHLNQALFNSTRLQEITDVIHHFQACYQANSTVLLGYSLGANFCLRISSTAAKQDLSLSQTIAICPVIDPLSTVDELEAVPIYQRYFVNKWQRSIAKKQRYFPTLKIDDEFLKAKSLRAMNAIFIPRYTDYETPESYLRAYAITDQTLASIASPCQIIASEDDPITVAQQLKDLTRPEHVNIEITQYGGHCGYIIDWRMRSWLELQLPRWLPSQQP